MFLNIILMTIVVFISRYLFLEPKLPIKLGTRAQRLLKYSSTSVLTAIWGPIVFMPHGHLILSDNAPYLIGALLTIALAWYTKDVLKSTLVSMGVFFILNLYVL